MAKECIQCVIIPAQKTFHVIHRVDEPTVQLDLPSSDDADTAWLTHTALVVAINVGTHCELAFFLD
jgi:hypothetical protein